MHRAKRRVMFLTWVLLAACTASSAQSRVTSSLVEMPRSQPQLPNAGSGYALTTSITGAPVALGAGDLLELMVFDTTELNQKVRVNAAGNIILPLIGELAVQGQSPEQVELLIREKLIAGRFVKNPQVSIFVAEYAGQLAYVNGEVMRPGAYPLLSSHRLLDVISVAGGMSPRAGNSVIIAHAVGAPETVDLTDPDEGRRNPVIHAGDNITVRQTGIVYVLGEVHRPGGFLLDRNTTLSLVQAVALAEGALPTAAITKARLIRTVQGNRQETLVNLKTILKADDPDPALQAGDVIYVPGSATRGMGRMSIQTILATASGVAIYAYHP